MWKDILKLSPEDRKKFTALADEYAPEDMEEASLNRNMANAAKDIERHTNKYKNTKNKIKANKKKIIAKEPNAYLAMQHTLGLMEESIGTDDFMTYYSAILNLARGYDIFHR